MSWSLSEKEFRLAHELANAYGILCAVRGPQGEGRSWLEEALLHGEGVPRALRQRALRRAANLAERQGALDTARAHARESLELARALDDPDEIGGTLLLLGIIEGDANNFELAADLHHEAIGVFSASNNEREACQALGMLGFLHLSLGAY
jgi:hypothetical protein